jgi:hypothetical protein
VQSLILMIWKQHQTQRGAEEIVEALP